MGGINVFVVIPLGHISASHLAERGVSGHGHHSPAECFRCRIKGDLREGMSCRFPNGLQNLGSIDAYGREGEFELFLIESPEYFKIDFAEHLPAR